MSRNYNARDQQKEERVDRRVDISNKRRVGRKHPGNQHQRRRRSHHQQAQDGNHHQPLEAATTTAWGIAVLHGRIIRKGKKRRPQHRGKVRERGVGKGNGNQNVYHQGARCELEGQNGSCRFGVAVLVFVFAALVWFRLLAR